MAYDGSLKFDTSMDLTGFQKDANRFTSIVKGMGVFSLLQKGFQMVANSIDSAVSRYDTLNRFPKVLEQMGYSANQASSATQKLSEGIKGLPTTLDGIVSNTQRIVSATGDLEKSVDTTLALNDAFLASGASSEDASRGMTQYIQMLSKGKVDAQSWLSLQETMSYALNKVAESFGFAGSSAQNDLYAALKDGIITFDELNAKFIELDAGVGGFAEVAKTATGGIGTAWTNMQTAIVRGSTSIIEAIDRGLSETKFKSIENVIQSLGTVFYNVLTSTAGYVDPVIANFDLLLDVILGVAAAFAIRCGIEAWKKALDQVNVAQGVAAAQGRDLNDVLTKNEDGSKRAALAELEHEASIKQREAAQKSAVATQLEEIAKTKEYEAAAAKAAAERLKSVEQIQAEKEATKANNILKKAEVEVAKLRTEATKANRIAKEAETKAMEEGATEQEKAIALELRATATKKKLEAAAADKTAQEKRETAAMMDQNAESLKSVQYIEAETMATKAEKAANEAATTAKTARTAATQASTEATAAQTAAQTAQNTSLTIGQAIVALLTGQITLHTAATVAATTATSLFGAALNALPFMFVMAGISALLAAITRLPGWIKSLNPAAQEAEEALKNVKHAVGDVKTALEESENTYNTNATAANANAGISRRAAAALQSVIAEYKNGSASAEELQAAINTLNSSTDGLNVTFDETTGALSLTNDAIKAYIDITEAAAKKNAINEHMDELRENLVNVVQAQEKAKEELRELNRQLGTREISETVYEAYSREICASLDDLGEEYEVIMSEISACEEDYTDVLEAEKTAQQNLIKAQECKIREVAEAYHLTTDSIEADLLENGQTIDEWVAANKEKLEENKDAIEELAAEWGLSTDAIIADIERQGITFEEWKENWEDLEESVKERTDGIVNSFGRIPDEFDMSAQEMLENLQANKETYASWESNMEEITRQLGPTAADEFRKLGPEANSAIEEILASTDLLDQYRETFGVKIDEATGVAIENWNDPDFIGAASGAIDESAIAVQNNTSLPDVAADKIEETQTAMTNAVKAGDFEAVGEQIADAIDDGLSGMGADTKTATTKMTEGIASVILGSVTNISNAMKKIADAVVKITDDMGTRADQSVKKSMTSFVSAIRSTQPQAVTASQYVMDGAVSSINSSQKDVYNAGYNIGYQIGNGIWYGLDSRQASILSKARFIANQILSIIRSALDIHSPSGEAKWLFKMFILGGVEGLEDNEKKLYRTIDDMSENALARMAKISDAMSDTFNKKMRVAINTTQSKAAAVAQSSSTVPANTAGTSKQTVNNYNMTSNFNSPKALNWRETKQYQESLRQQLELLGG